MAAGTNLDGNKHDGALASKIEQMTKSIVKVDMSSLLKNLVHHSFKKIFNSRRLVRLFSGNSEHMKTVNQIFENQIQIIQYLIELTN